MGKQMLKGNGFGFSVPGGRVQELGRRRRSTFVDAPDVIWIEMAGHPAAVG